MMMIVQLVLCLLLLSEIQATYYNEEDWGYHGVTSTCKSAGGTTCKDVCGGCGQYGTGTKCSDGSICCCVDDSECLCQDSCGTNLQPGPGLCCDKSKTCCVKQHDPCYYNELLHDVARGKKAIQSSNYITFVAAYAVDGNTKTFSHTHAEHQPFWRVDLGRDYKIGRIEVQNRLLCCGERFHDVEVTIGPTLDDMQLCVHYKGPGKTGQLIILCCPEAIVGRYVQLTITPTGGKEYLQLAELKAMAFPHVY